MPAHDRYFREPRDLARHLRQLVRADLRQAQKQVLDTVGKEIQHEVKEVLIGRITPLQATGPFPAWDKLKPSTLTRKAEEGLGKNSDPRSMLYATGMLYQSIGVQRSMAALSVTIGTNIPYAEVLERGNPWHNMGPRPFFGPAAIRVIPRLLPRIEKLLGDTIAGI